MNTKEMAKAIEFLEDIRGIYAFNAHSNPKGEKMEGGI